MPKKTVAKLPNGLLAKPVTKDVLMVVDIDRSTVTDELFNHLVSSNMEYRDQVHKEHLINIEGAMDDCPKKFRRAITTLRKIADNQVAGYIRFTNN